MKQSNTNSGGFRIFPRGVRQFQNWDYFANFLAEDCMKMKEFGPSGGGGEVPGALFRSVNH